MIVSYTTVITSVLLGSSRTESPFSDLNIEKSNALSYSITVSNNLVDGDFNLYELKTQSKVEFDALYSLLESESRVITHLIKNHCTISGQYLELIYKDQLIKIDIEVKSSSLRKSLVC